MVARLGGQRGAGDGGGGGAAVGASVEVSLLPPSWRPFPRK